MSSLVYFVCGVGDHQTPRLENRIRRIRRNVRFRKLHSNFRFLELRALGAMSTERQREDSHYSIVSDIRRGKGENYIRRSCLILITGNRLVHGSLFTSAMYSLFICGWFKMRLRPLINHWLSWARERLVNSHRYSFSASVGYLFLVKLFLLYPSPL